MEGDVINLTVDSEIDSSEEAVVCHTDESLREYSASGSSDHEDFERDFHSGRPSDE